MFKLKKWHLLVIITVALIIFFWPKINNRWEDSFTSYGTGKEPISMDCTCIGVPFWKPGLTRSDIQVKFCSGIPISCRCYTMISGNSVNIPCN